MFRVFLSPHCPILSAFVLMFGASLLVSASIARAEEPFLPTPLEEVSCFDYYKFGSVQVDVSASTSVVAFGTTVTFAGEIKNENDYPVVEGGVYVKIYRKQTDDSLTQRNGHHLVDQFFVEEDISLPANGTRPISFTWQIPAAAPSGDYMLATFFVVDRKFNLLGLTFTDDILGNRAEFSVRGENDGVVHFDKNATTVQGEPYLFAAFTPKLSSREPVVVATEAQNDTDTDRTVHIMWEVYRWDALREEHLVERKEQALSLGAGESRTTQYVVADTRYPVYLVVATLDDRGAKSILGVRFTREDVAAVRLNYPAIAVFPFKKHESGGLFSCAHGAGTLDKVAGNNLTLTLKDKRGNTIYQTEYKGVITGAMMGFHSEFLPEKNYDYIALEAELRQGERLIERSNLIYDCKQIDPNSCGRRVGIYVLIIGALVAVLAGAYFYRRRIQVVGSIKGFPRKSESGRDEKN